MPLESQAETQREQYGAETLKQSNTKLKIKTVVQRFLNDGLNTKTKVISIKYKELVNVHMIRKEEPNSVD